MAVTFLAAIAALWFVTNPYLLHRPWKSIELLTFGRVVASYPESENRLDTLRPRIANLLHVGLVSSGGLDHWLGAHGADAVLIAAGAVLLGIQICSKKRGRWRRRRSLAFAMWAGITMAGIGWWAPFAWNRWYLPAEPCWAMLEAMGLCALALGAQSLLRISFRIVSGSAGNSRD